MAGMVTSCWCSDGDSIRVSRDLARDVEADVVAHLGPFVVLFGEHGAGETDQAGAVGEDPDDVGAAADLAVQPFLGVVRPDLTPDRFREPGEGQDVA